MLFVICAVVVCAVCQRRGIAPCGDGGRSRGVSKWTGETPLPVMKKRVQSAGFMCRAGSSGEAAMTRGGTPRILSAHFGQMKVDAHLVLPIKASGEWEW